MIYWDASAILSVLFTDRNSEIAGRWAHKEGIHLISSLARAETYAVIARFRREGQLTDILIKAVYEVLEDGPWRNLTIAPEKDIILPLSVKYPLRGADLWHLATAKSLQRQLPELFLLTFDARLQEAGEGERLSGGK